MRGASLVNLDALITAAQAATIAGVTRHNIAWWVRERKLSSMGMRGRSPLYRLGDVLDIEQATRESRKSHRSR